MHDVDAAGAAPGDAADGDGAPKEHAFPGEAGEAAGVGELALRARVGRAGAHGPREVDGAEAEEGYPGVAFDADGALAPMQRLGELVGARIEDVGGEVLIGDGHAIAKHV